MKTVSLTQNEYKLLKNEINELKARMKKIEAMIKFAQRNTDEGQILNLAKEARKLAKKGRLPLLRSLKDLR